MKTIEQVREDAAVMLSKLHAAQSEALTTGKLMKVEVEQDCDSVTLRARVYTDETRYTYDAKQEFEFKFDTDDRNNDELCRLQDAFRVE